MQQADRQALAAELLEMGEQLFDLALAGHDVQQTISNLDGQDEKGEDGGEAYPVEEIRAASGEFFKALRLLLGGVYNR